jgi:hypothetical protein
MMLLASELPLTRLRSAAVFNYYLVTFYHDHNRRLREHLGIECQRQWS